MRRLVQLRSTALMMGLRGFSLIARFMLSIFMAKYMSLETLGVFGILTGIVAVAPAILGFGLNYFLNREIIDQPVGDAILKLRDKVFTSALALIVFTSIFIALITVGWLDLQISAIVLITIVALEIIAFDVHYVLISMRMPIFANCLIFIRSALWVYPFLTLAFFLPAWRSLETLLLFWISGLIIFYISFFFFTRHWNWASIFREPVNSSWLRVRIKDGVLIYLSDLGVAGTAYLNRFALAFVTDTGSLGVFTFFTTIAAAIDTLLTTSITQPEFPRILGAYNKHGHGALMSAVKIVAIRVAGIGLAITIIASAVFITSVGYLGQPLLADHRWNIIFFMLTVVVQSTGGVISIGTVAAASRSTIAFLNIADATLMVLATVTGFLSGGLTGACVGMFAQSLVMISLRTRALQRTASVAR